jgi:GTP-binding protein Era
VDSIVEKPQKDMSVIKARIICPVRYKKMIIGTGGSKIKEIGMMARRELELATNRKIFLELTVEED